MQTDTEDIRAGRGHQNFTATCHYKVFICGDFDRYRKNFRCILDSNLSVAVLEIIFCECYNYIYGNVNCPGGNAVY